MLTAAGFAEIGLEPITLNLRLGTDAAEATDYLADSGVGRAVLETVPDHDRPAALTAVRAALADHTATSGVHLDAAIWLITATRSRSISNAKDGADPWADREHLSHTFGP